MAPPLLLASGSPRRADLLTSAGIEYTVMPVNIEENRVEGEAPTRHAKRLAAIKAKAAAARKQNAVILGADTVVWSSPKHSPIGKPTDRAEARGLLARLARPDAPHFVTTAYAVLDGTADDRMHLGHETTRVWMRRLSAAEIEAYLETGEWQDKAGGYGIQGRAAGFVTKLEGSYTNVVGLPLAQVIELLDNIDAL